MFLSEVVILIAIASARDAGRELLILSIDVISEYIGYLRDSLVRRSYIKGDSSRGYQLTLNGTEELIKFMDENRNRFGEVTKILQQLGIKTSQQINKLEKEATKAK